MMYPTTGRDDERAGAARAIAAMVASLLVVILSSGCAAILVHRRPGMDPALTREELIVSWQILQTDEQEVSVDPPSSGGAVRWSRKTNGTDELNDLVLSVVRGQLGLPPSAAE